MDVLQFIVITYGRAKNHMVGYTGGDGVKDLPMFTTENGVASLTLREIPYSKRAYIRIQSSVESRKLLQECVDFCRAVGAEEIYAAGDSLETMLPHYTDILEMCALRTNFPDTDATAVQVEEQQLLLFREIYNEKMRNVPNAAHFTDRDSRDMLKGQCGYVVIQQNKVIGIGIAADNTVEMLASLERGKGSDVLSALAMRLCSEQVRVIVASANLKAMALYESLGFKTVNIIGRWFKIV